MAVESVAAESFPADALVRPFSVPALGHGVAVEEVEQALVVVGAAVLELTLQRVAVVAQAFERPDSVLAFAVPLKLPEQKVC